MNSIAKLSAEDRNFIFLRVSEETGLSTAIVEKDYWICYVLDFLFRKSNFKDVLVFKGGTSLSKGFNLINRMSEDIDLILDWRMLGDDYNIESIRDDDQISKTKMNQKKKDILSKTDLFLMNTFAPSISKGISADLGYPIDIKCEVENGSTVVYIDYPKCVTDEYLLDVIKLEIGPLAALTPTILVNIKPYCANSFGNLFKYDSVSVKTVTPERTFWEKATILHRESLRPKEKHMPIRYFRHYYDLYMLSISPYKDNAMSEISLLCDVIRFKEKFYRETWMNYNDIFTTGIRLVPDKYRFSELKNDYDKMKQMINKLVSFDEIMESLSILENEINNAIIFNRKNK